MRRAHSGQASGNDLAAFRHELRQQANVFVVDGLDLFDAKFADLLAPEILSSAFAATRATRTRRPTLAPIGTVSE